MSADPPCVLWELSLLNRGRGRQACVGFLSGRRVLPGTGGSLPSSQPRAFRLLLSHPIQWREHD